jgi:hypothetical protein
MSDENLCKTGYHRESSLLDAEDGGNRKPKAASRRLPQASPSSKIVIMPPHQGRFSEVNVAGETVFEFLNTCDEKEMLIMPGVKWMPLDYFDVTDKSLCQWPTFTSGWQV